MGTEVWSNATGSAVLSFAITDLVDVEDFESHYYHYWGSLTTPPCTPAVSWHLAQNIIPVRQTTMDKFREKTALWTTSGGYVDATTNFRPVQSNPSCISKCAGDSELEYCPLGTELEEEDEDSAKLMPLWISLGVLVAILLVLLIVRFARTSKQQPLDKPRPNITEMTRVPTVESAMDDPTYGGRTNTVFDEPMPERSSHSSERVNNI